MSATETPSMDTVAENVLATASHELALDSPDYPQPVRDAAADFRMAVEDTLAAGRQLEADLAELHGKRDLLPTQGWNRLRNEALHEATQRAESADRRAAVALDQLKAALTDAALPRLDPSREALARQEFAMLVGEASGTTVSARLVSLARAGNREALSVAFTQFGRSLLETRGVTGRDFTETMDAVRATAAATASEHGTTRRELLAGAALPRIAKLGAAKGAAGAHVLNIVRDA